MVMTHTHAKGQDQRSFGSKDSRNGRTDGRTEGGDCITSRAKVVVINAIGVTRDQLEALLKVVQGSAIVATGYIFK